MSRGFYFLLIPFYFISIRVVCQYRQGYHHQRRECDRLQRRKREMRKLTQGGGVSLNKEKLAAFDQMVTPSDLLDDKYLLVQQGKKKYFLLIVK